MVGDASNGRLRPAGGRLMLSKLDPPEAGRAVVVRSRLIDRLASAAQGQITLVTAPAGAGKTTLLRSWLAAGRVPGVPVWVSLDAADRDPATFWSYVVAALDRVGLALPSGPEIDSEGTPVSQKYTLRADAHDFLTFPKGIRPALPIDAATAAEEDEAWVIDSALTHIELSVERNALPFLTAAPG